MKRLNFFFALMCAIVFCQSARAEEVVIDGLYYSLDESARTATVIANSNSTYTGDIVIPSTVTYSGNTYNVIAVGEKAFDQSTITSLVVSEGVTTLGKGGFDNCKKLKSVSLPKSLKFVGEHCFGNNYVLEKIAYPEGITELPFNCNVSNWALVEVSLPESLTTLGEGCFGYCKSLKNITIPKNVTSLGLNCFWAVYLKTMTVLATTPPDATKRWAFPFSVDTLYVPEIALDAYKSTSPWKNAKVIKALETSGDKESGRGEESGGDKVWVNVTDSNMDDLTDGSIIKIYPHGKSVKVYAKNGNLSAAETPEETSSNWGLIDAGNGYFYILNMDGQYWAAAEYTSPFKTMTCTVDLSKAAKVALVWNPAYSGVAFKNSTTGKYLNDLNDLDKYFNWWNDSEEALTEDSYSTFDLILRKDQKFVTSITRNDHNGIVDKGGVAYYTLSGTRLNNRPQKDGIYIQVKNGKSQKVVVKRNQ